MYTDILFPTDGSSGASAAIEHARDLAERYDATVHVLHVVNSSYVGYTGGDGAERSPSGMLGGRSDETRSGMLGGDSDETRSGMLGGDHEELRDEIRERAIEIVEEVERQFEGVDTEGIIHVGDPYQVILAYADHADIDLVVMGTHGRRGVDRYLLGSVTEKVVRMSDVPVVTVRDDAEPPKSEGAT
ncbi:universal stress protein [Natronorubrum texcoconense]|uniref:Nucleotide-binding universal stress protein, UspA family n=1 Tax=Natronorubrum texcoconense TaxID=1095776 RepID=A0A1G8U2R0_9EURY|nr:universal stress protein [Natronorubrum texcoconense]SDJ48013.1 Nucleotide-binding universal stress protein, UspA family [Natronorubrum texcoconense]